MMNENKNIIISIDGAQFDGVSNITFGKERICKEERSMNGTMIIDLIAIKDTYELSWNIMSIETLEKISKLVDIGGENAIFVELIIEMAVSGTNKRHIIRKVVYLSDIAYTPYFYNQGFMWKDVMLKFTEK